MPLSTFKKPKSLLRYKKVSFHKGLINMPLGEISTVHSLSVHSHKVYRIQPMEQIIIMEPSFFLVCLLFIERKYLLRNNLQQK